MDDELETRLDRMLLDSDESGDTSQLADHQNDLSASDEDDAGDDGTGGDDLRDDDVRESYRWPFTDMSGINFDAVVGCNEPVDFYRLYVDDALISFIVDETNRYGHQKNPNWASTTVFELKKLLALTMQMGIMKLPTLRDYWSGDTVFGGRPICAAVMPRARFESLLSNIHLADNATADRTDRLYKVTEFIRKFNQRCQEVYSPGKEVCIDESLIPFRGRIIFRQYIPNKRHRYGIKAFKLCTRGGYTYRMSIYAGKSVQPRTGSVADDVVMRLMGGLLDRGRVLYTDNWYTSVDLAKKLLRRKTNLVGTVRRNRRGLPKVVTETKIKRGDLVARQNQDGILVLKWRDKRDVLMLSTLHDHATDNAGKPLVVGSYSLSQKKCIMSFRTCEKARISESVACLCGHA